MAHKRSAEEDDENESSGKERRVNYIYVADMEDIDKIKIALNNGCESAKIIIENNKGISPWLKPSIINQVFKNITIKEDIIKITNDKKLFFESGNIKSFENIFNLISDTENAKYRLIEESISTKYVIKDIDSQLTLDEIVEDLNENNILISKIVRFKTKVSKSPTKTIMFQELGKTMRREIKLFRMNMKLNKYEDRPKVCMRCLAFGHFQKDCSLPKLCDNCSKSHEGVCNYPTCCIRCGLEHRSDSFVCKLYKIEKKCLFLKKKLNISMYAARKKVEMEDKSYAEVTKTQIINNVERVKEKETLKEENKELKEQVSSLENNLNKLNLIVENLVKKVESYENLKELNKQILDKYKDLTKNYQILQNENEELKRQLKEIFEENIKLKTGLITDFPSSDNEEEKDWNMNREEESLALDTS